MFKYLRTCWNDFWAWFNTTSIELHREIESSGRLDLDLKRRLHDEAYGADSYIDPFGS